MALRLLVIQDDEGIRQLIDRLLNPEDYDVILAGNSEVFVQITNIQPDVIILDEWMCNENGGDLCKRLKEDSSTAAIPVILISAMIAPKEFYKQTGANGFLRKPFDLDDLKLALNPFS